MFPRTLESVLRSRMHKGKAILLVGARQVGKTTLIKTVLKNTEYLFLDADDPDVRSILTNPNTEQLRSLIGSAKIIFIDEAQRIKDIGVTLKIVIDQFKDVQLFVSGSSSYDLGNALNEPLTGRTWAYQLFPITWEEYEAKQGYLNAARQLENRLLYGFYPDVLNHPGDEKEILKNLVNSYLYRDILAFSEIRRSETLEKLLQALALQMGSEVNYAELAQTVGLNKLTVQRYIEILEKGYVLFRLNGFSRNVRTEIKRNRKIYFYDNGVRNMILGNFTPLDLRADVGALWENFLISERRKQNSYKNRFAHMYFWRTTQQQEIDYVEEEQGQVRGYEFKWNAAKRVRAPKTFINAYNADFEQVDKNNFRDFVL